MCSVSVSVGLFSLSCEGLWVKQSLRSSWEEPFGEYATAINPKHAVSCSSCWTRVPQYSLCTGITASKGYLKVNTEVVHHCADTLFLWEAETYGLLCMPCKYMWEVAEFKDVTSNMLRAPLLKVPLWVFFVSLNVIAVVLCSLVSVSWSRMLLRQHMVSMEQLHLKNSVGLVIPLICTWTTACRDLPKEPLSCGRVAGFLFLLEGWLSNGISNGNCSYSKTGEELLFSLLV